MEDEALKKQVEAIKQAAKKACERLDGMKKKMGEGDDSSYLDELKDLLSKFIDEEKGEDHTPRTKRKKTLRLKTTPRTLPLLKTEKIKKKMNQS